MKGYCGCCGRPTDMLVEDYWCRKCSEHVVSMPYFRGPVACGLRPPAWERTYFAQHDKDCPFALRGPENNEVAPRQTGQEGKPAGTCPAPILTSAPAQEKP